MKIKNLREILGWSKAAQDAVLPHLENVPDGPREPTLGYRDIGKVEQDKQRLEAAKLALEDGDIEAAKRLLEDIKL